MIFKDNNQAGTSGPLRNGFTERWITTVHCDMVHIVHLEMVAWFSKIIIILEVFLWSHLLHFFVSLALTADSYHMWLDFLNLSYCE
jgi:hypothetical protein